MLNKEYLEKILRYEDGKLFWKEPKLGRNLNKEAGCILNNGYKVIGINGKNYLNHRVIFMMHHGFFPKLIDHIDRNTLNNKIENLRQATKSQNGFNTKIHIDNKAGHKNINFVSRINKYQVQLMVNGKKMHFGTYFDIDVAKFVAETMRYKYHGKFSFNA
jgi:hypothetical protein